MEATGSGRIIRSTAWAWRTRTKEWRADSAVISRVTVLLRVMELSQAMGLMPTTEVMQAPAATQTVGIPGAGFRDRKLPRP